VFDVKRVKIKSVDDYGENQCIDLEEEYSNIRRRPPRSKDRKHERQGQRDLESKYRVLNLVSSMIMNLRE
jgi:hypothetical protein